MCVSMCECMSECVCVWGGCVCVCVCVCGVYVCVCVCDGGKECQSVTLEGSGVT